MGKSIRADEDKLKNLVIAADLPGMIAGTEIAITPDESVDFYEGFLSGLIVIGGLLDNRKINDPQISWPMTRFAAAAAKYLKDAREAASSPSPDAEGEQIAQEVEAWLRDNFNSDAIPPSDDSSFMK